MNFTILSNGLVQGGSASYSVDQFGVVTYQASVKVGKWFLSKTYQSQGTYKVDPAILSPENISLGKVITIGALVMTVLSVNTTQALVSLVIAAQSATGNATLLNNGPVIVLNTIDATVSVLGMKLSIGLRPA
jgi:hypothetical protein